MMIYRAILALLIVFACVGPTFGETITLTSGRDATLYENNGARSNGAGGVYFTGTNSSGSPRRGLLWFDLTSVPAAATIDSVQLKLTVGGVAGGGSDPFPYVTSLHRVSRTWGEGAIGAGSNTAGSGQGFTTPADGTSATWTHAFLSNQPWTTAGGDFTATPSAAVPVSGTADASFTWGSTPAMVADVQGWLNNPATNFGWAVLGNELELQSFRSFHAREATNAAFRPALTVSFTPVPEPSTLILSSAAGVAFLGARLWRRSCRR